MFYNYCNIIGFLCNPTFLKILLCILKHYSKTRFITFTRLPKGDMTRTKVQNPTWSLTRTPQHPSPQAPCALY